MVLVNISILPHGALLLDLDIPDIPSRAKVMKLQNGFKDASQLILESCPDTCILLTPHGIALKDSVGIYLNDSLEGSCEWCGAWKNYKVNCVCDSSCASEILEYFSGSGIQCEGITSFAKAVSAPLAWGESVPLWFCRESIDKGMKVVVLSWPQKRFSPVDYAMEAHKIGQLISQYCNRSSKRYAVICSCDLSHVHGSESSLPTIFQGAPSLGEDKIVAENFDQLIVRWAEEIARGDTRASYNTLFDEASSSVLAAKVCGWSGFCAVQGCLSQTLLLNEEINNTIDSSPRRVTWSGGVLSYDAPTYYGMMVMSVGLSPN